MRVRVRVRVRVSLTLTLTLTLTWPGALRASRSGSISGRCSRSQRCTAQKSSPHPFGRSAGGTERRSLIASTGVENLSSPLIT